MLPQILLKSHFYNGSNLLDTATLSSGAATYTTSSLAVGTYTITAVYAGVSGQFLGSTSAIPKASNPISTIAGGGSSTASGIAATAASLSHPSAVVEDSAGDLYIANYATGIVQKVTPGGIISTIAGNGTLGSTGNGGQATAAELVHPAALALDSSADLFIADMGAAVVREVTPDGVIHAFAGNGTSGNTGNGSQATAAEFEQPSALAFDSSGDLYIADAGANVVREVLTTGVVQAFAGNGTAGSTGNTGRATAAELNAPKALAFDNAGNLYIADSGSSEVRKVTPAGVISQFTSGLGPDGLAFDAAGNLYVAYLNYNQVVQVTPDGVSHSNFAGNGTANYMGDGGPASSAEVDNPYGLFVDTSGDLIIADASNNRVRMVKGPASITIIPSPYFTVTSTPANVPAGTAEEVVVTAYNSNGTVNTSYSGTVHFTSSDSAATLPANSTLTSGVGTFYVTFGTLGSQSITVTDTASSSITGSETGINVDYVTQTTLTASANSIDTGTSVTFTATVAAPSGTPTGTVNFYDGTTLLGTGTLSAGAATYTTSSLAAGTHAIEAVYQGVAGQYLSSDSTATSSSLVSAVAGNGTAGGPNSSGQATAAELNHPDAIIEDSAGDIYIANSGDHVVQEITTDGVIHTIAGNGTSGDTGDGSQASAAKLETPDALALDTSGDLFIADFAAHVVREVLTSGIIKTFAGNGTSGLTGNGSQATAAELEGPDGLAFDTSGNLYISDGTGNEVRKVTPGGVISVFAGTGTAGSSGNGGQATAAKLSGPQQIAFDTAGNLYIAEQGNHDVRKVTSAGAISVYAGNGTSGSTGNGGQATAAELEAPTGLALDGYGDLFITDSAANVVREVTPGGVISTIVGNGTTGASGNGGAASAAELNDPLAIALDTTGDLFIADTGSNEIREVSAALPFSVLVPYFTVTGIASPVAVGSPQMITVTAYHGNNTINTSYSGTVHLTSSDGMATLGANATLTNGVGTFNVTFMTLGTDSVTATDTVNNTLTGTESGIPPIVVIGERLL